MTLARYLLSNLGEYALLLVTCGRLAVVAENAFFLESATYRAPITFTACAVLLAVLYLAAYRRERRMAFAVVYMGLVAALVAGALALSTGDVPYEDAEGNFLYLALCIAGSATACFLLTRTLPGSAAWFLACAFVCSTVQAFYEFEAVAESLAAVAAALALVVFRNFKISLLKADVAREAPGNLGRLAPILAASCAPVAIAGAAALALWFGVIAPLSPGVLDVKLITEYRQLPVVELRGVADEKPILNLEMTTENLVEGYRYTTDDLVQDDFAADTVDGEALMEWLLFGGSTDEGMGDDAGEEGGLDRDSTDDEYNALSYTETPPVALIALAVIAIVAALIALVALTRRAVRRRRLEKMLEGSPAEQATSIYQFLLTRLERIGLGVPAGMTLSEFAKASATRMEPYGRAAGVPFSKLTEVYEQCAYGQHEPDEDEIVPFVAWYLTFWRTARRQLGMAKYLVRSLRL